MALSIYSRYRDVDLVEVDGRLSLEQAPRLLPVRFPDSTSHLLVAGETLDQLALRYYGREELWWRIADANPGKPPHAWSAGDRLEIPPLRAALRAAPK